MVSELEVHSLSNLGLTLFNGFVLKFFDMAALDAHQVIMMIAAVQFEDRVAALKMVTHDQAGGLKLGQHPIDGRKPNLFTIRDEGFENFFRAEVLALFAPPFKNI